MEFGFEKREVTHRSMRKMVVLNFVAMLGTTSPTKKHHSTFTIFDNTHDILITK
jgi:hypothetical protein